MAWPKLFNQFRKWRLAREFEEELQSHVDEAIANGRDPREVQRALGSKLRLREQSLDARLFIWLDSLLQDVRFGVRNLFKNSLTSVASFAALSLATLACATTFHLLDALHRPLPVKEPSQLFSLSLSSTMPGFDGSWDTFPHTTFLELQTKVAARAEMFVATRSATTPVTVVPAAEAEVANLQFVSGNFFSILGLPASAGRLFHSSGGPAPGADPYAVISHAYWQRRFGGSDEVVGTVVRLGGRTLTVVGVAGPQFRGIEPGVPVDLFVPISMSSRFENPNWSGVRVLGRWTGSPQPARLAEELEVQWRVLERDRLAQLGMLQAAWIDDLVRSTSLSIRTARGGVSVHQSRYGFAVRLLFGLAGLVLLVAAANVANLRVGHSLTRRSELGLRIAIGAGRARLLRLLTVESLLLVLAASGFGLICAKTAASRLVGMFSTSREPLDFAIEAGPRFWVFGTVILVAVTVGCALIPSFIGMTKARVGSRRDRDTVSRSGFAYAMLSLQVAFCVLLVIVGIQFAAGLERLHRIPLGVDTEGLVNIELTATPAQAPSEWERLTDELSAIPGVTAAALADWALLHGSSTNARVAVPGFDARDSMVEFYCVSPGWQKTVGVPILEGMGFAQGARYPDVAMVNRTFVEQFLEGNSATGRTIERIGLEGQRTPMQVVGTLADVRIKELKAPVPPTVFTPCAERSDMGLAERTWATVVLRAEAGQERAILLQAEGLVADSPIFRWRDGAPQNLFVNRQILRERVLAALGGFFGLVALLLAAVGLFAILRFSLQQRRREIGLRLAVGGPPEKVLAQILRGLVWAISAGVVVGTVSGTAVLWVARVLIHEMDLSNPALMALPLVVVMAAAVLAALPAVLPALRTDPNQVLREG